MSLLMEALRKAEKSKAAVEKKVNHGEGVAVTEAKKATQLDAVKGVDFGISTLDAKTKLPEEEPKQDFLEGLTFGESVQEQKKLLKKVEEQNTENKESLTLTPQIISTVDFSKGEDSKKINVVKAAENKIEDSNEFRKNEVQVELIEEKVDQKPELLSGLIHDQKAFLSNDNDEINRAVLAAKRGAQKKEKKNKLLISSLIIAILIISGLFLYPLIFKMPTRDLSQILLASDSFDEFGEDFENDMDTEVINIVENNEITDLTLPMPSQFTPSVPEEVSVGSMDETINQTADIKNDTSQISSARNLSELASVNIQREDPQNFEVEQENIIGQIEQVATRSIFTSRNVVGEAESLVDSAYQAYQNGNLLDAKYYYEIVLEKTPGHRGALLGLSSIAIKEGRQAAALDNYSRLLERDPSDPLAQAGIFNVTEADPLSQESGLKQLINDYPQLPHLEFALGNTYSVQSRWNEAQQAYFNALNKAKAGTIVLAEISPDYAYNLAISLEHLNKPELAIQYYREALQNASAASANFDISIVQSRLAALGQ